jgi:hypothetical protein
MDRVEALRLAFRKAAHFHANDAKTVPLNDGEDLAGLSLRHSVGFDDCKGTF